MIKDLTIQNTGRIKQLKAEGETNFKPLTFIFGRNTFGKSTITAVLRSLLSNNPDFIVGRKRIGGESQSAKVVTVKPDSEHAYATAVGKWTKPLESMVVFDSDFVRESVYTQNQQIDSIQQKQIETFMLGAQAKVILKAINQLDEKINENSKIQSASTAEYNRSRHALGGLAFDDFLQLEEVENVDDQIAKKNDELERIKNSEFIKSKLEGLKSLLQTYSDFDTSGLLETLTVDSSVIAAHFSEHIDAEHSKKDYGAFLRSGAKLRSREDVEKCPFCTQDIDAPDVKEFLQTIDSIYNEKYQNLQESIRNAERSFVSENHTSTVSSIVSDLKKVGYAITTDHSVCDAGIKSSEKAIADKKENLAVEFDVTEIDQLKTTISEVVGELDKEIATFSNPAEQKVSAGSELNQLKAASERHGAWKDRCLQYELAKSGNATLTEQRKQKWTDYEEYAKDLSDKCLSEINAFLDKVGCNFKVEKFEFQGNRRGDLFALSMQGEEVSSIGEDHEMNIKNTLSDSDKWVLALAFFVVGAKNEDGVDIVVMDDPVSSFDADRKRLVLKQVMQAFKDSGKQLILLTHERGFFKLAHHEYDDGASTTFLKLNHCATEGTTIIVTDPTEDKDFINKYLEWVMDMKKAVDSHDETEVKSAHSHIRKVVEHILKSKYPNWISKGDNTVDRMLTTLEVDGGPYEHNSLRTDLKDVLHNLEHHDNSGVDQYPDEELGIEDYKNDIKKGFEVIEKL